ncbi:hypothetical protein [Nocardia sp. CNY236]|uniref:hypothetical protein n=1 Tax=Nocardia sp. CNY236 TaxID=1169152 RepID=UPI0003F976C9|nr:hypothetical protein [Nocardia sp. CNY236]
MTVSDTDGTALLYSIEISEPGYFGKSWWRIASAGEPRQVAAALTELAVRTERDIQRGRKGGRCWYRYDVRWSDGAVLESFQGAIRSVLIPGELRCLAVALSSAVDLDLRSAQQPPQ